MGVCAVGAWLVRCKWLGMLANKMLYKTTILNTLSRDSPRLSSSSTRSCILYPVGEL